jgi:molybdenum cofactor cytidylyltransferase
VIPAIVLAAGRSSRMGRAKATLPLDDGDTFLTRIVRTFRDAGVDDVIVVVGHEADAIATSFAKSGLAARFVVNAAYDRGQLGPAPHARRAPRDLRCDRPARPRDGAHVGDRARRRRRGVAAQRPRGVNPHRPPRRKSCPR